MSRRSMSINSSFNQSSIVLYVISEYIVFGISKEEDITYDVLSTSIENSLGYLYIIGYYRNV